MKDRAVVSPVQIYADGNLNIHADGSQKAIMCVMSARDFRNESESAPKDLKSTEGRKYLDNYKKECKDQTKLYIRSSLENGANMLVDCGFGRGAFAKTGIQNVDEATENIFVETWVDEMAKEIKRNPKLQVVIANPNGPLVNKIMKRLKEYPKQANNITISSEGEMTVDIAHLAAKNGFTPSFRVAGDPSGVMGQYATQVEDGLDHLAQDEQAYFCTTGGQQNVDVPNAKDKRI